VAAEGMRDMVTIGGVHIQAGGTASSRLGVPLKGKLGLESMLLIRSTCVVFPRFEVKHD
jgi:hypothetical protein